MLTEVKLDPARTHFMGHVPRAKYLDVLRVSAAHVYLTYPFVLSWSLLEAMACGAAIVASDTTPVREVISDGRNGRIVDFFAVQAIAQKVLDVLHARGEQVVLRQQARLDAQQYSRERGLAGYEKLLGVVGSSGVVMPGQVAPLHLTEPERELLRWLAAGHSYQRIAEMRRRSPATVRNQVCALYEKLGVSKRAEAVAKAAALNLLETGIVTNGGGS